MASAFAASAAPKRVPRESHPGLPDGGSERAHHLCRRLQRFQLNDGYVDVIGTVKGAPTPADNVTLASPTWSTPNLIDVIDTVPADQRYSFMFDGNAQEIDHVLITQNMLPRFVELQYGRTRRF